MPGLPTTGEIANRGFQLLVITVKLRRLRNEIHVSAQTTAGRSVNGRSWPFQNVERLHLIEARNDAISIENFSLSVLEKLRVDAADIWNAI